MIDKNVDHEQASRFYKTHAIFRRIFLHWCTFSQLSDKQTSWRKSDETKTDSKLTSAVFQS